MISEVANGIHMISLPFPRTRVKSINEMTAVWLSEEGSEIFS